MPGEFDLISWICAQQRATELVRVPAGDDLAILKWDAQDLLLVGTDQVLDGVHFDSRIHSARQIGRKAMNRNLSDCAAMACLPAAAVATVAVARGTGMEYARELYLGIAEAADAFACPIVGGDTASWDGRLVVTVSILGRSAGIEPVRRSGARPGDFVYVTGPLGGSLLGRHMSFEPRIALARQLVSLAPVSSMIDLSDGLSRDLRHICQQSKVGAVIYAEQIPIHDDAVALGMRDGTPALEHALHDGEDHELLLTSPHEFAPTIAKRIGRIVAEPGIWLEKDGKRQPLEPRGWEHTF
ncbi:thiamine-phosphate kinase [Fontivita pretiosa]|uniref:thiamine-phosphate kinase n=1 Tax=Fontivita pretiosa TaxID=2989684 RepID=UPI003D1755B9